MSTFDPYDLARASEPAGCICGRHRSHAEHDFATRLALQCAPAANEAEHREKDKRFAGVVATAAMRAAFGRPPRA